MKLSAKPFRATIAGLGKFGPSNVHGRVQSMFEHVCFEPTFVRACNHASDWRGLLPLEHALVFLEEERVMQQSSVSISLSFCEPRYQSSRRLQANRLVPAQTIKNLATNTIKGLSIPSWSLAKVRSNKDSKINIFGIFVVQIEM